MCHDIYVKGLDSTLYHRQAWWQGGGGEFILVINQGPMVKGGPFLMKNRMYYTLSSLSNDKFASIIINNESFSINHYIALGP